MNSSIWHLLAPKFLCFFLLESFHALVWRNGKYMKRISDNDTRCIMLLSLSRVRDPVVEEYVFVELTRHTFLKYLDNGNEHYTLCRHYRRHDETGDIDTKFPMH